MTMKIFIHTCPHESLSAAVSEYSFRKFAKKEGVEIETYILSLEKSSSWKMFDGSTVVRNGKEARWDYHSPQAHLPLRFTIADHADDLCLVVDPDVFAIKPYVKALRDLHTKPNVISARPVIGGSQKLGHNSAVMLLDAGSLKDWRTSVVQDLIFNKHCDIQDLIYLKRSPIMPDEVVIEQMPKIFNEYDAINNDTVLMHLTNQNTQPWKTGLSMHGKIIDNKPIEYQSIYKSHPNVTVQSTFFSLLKEAIDEGFIDQEYIVYQIRRGYIRSDIMDEVYKGDD
jgi:hypothetical protein